MVLWLALLGLAKDWKSGAASAVRMVAGETASAVASEKPGCSRRMPRAPGWSKNMRPEGSCTMSNSRSCSKRMRRIKSWLNWERDSKVPPGMLQ